MFWRSLLTLSLLCLIGCEPDDPKGSGGSAGNGGSGGSNGNNAAPIANAGADLMASGDSLVTLDGTGSSDPNGDALTYTWRQTGGAAVELFNGNSDKPTFFAPGFSGKLTFELTVNDGQVNSTPDSVDVTVIGYSGDRADILGSPTDPTGLLTTSKPRDLALSGNTLAVADETQGIHFVDVSKAPEMTILSTVTGPAFDVEMAGTTTYGLIGVGDLLVLDAANPAMPKELARIEGSKNTAPSMHGNANVLAFDYEQNGVILVDATKSGYYPLAKIPTSDYNNIVVVGNKLYAGRGAEFRIFDIANPAAPTLLGTFNDGQDSYVVDVEGSLAYVVGSDKLRIIDVSNPSSPQLRGTTSLPQSGIYVEGTVGCARTATGIAAVDLSNPDAPVVAGTVDLGTSTYSYDMGGGHCYAISSGKVHVIDMTNPAAPTVVTALPRFARGVKASGNWLYVTAGDSVEVLDVTNKAAIQSILKYNLPGPPGEMALVGNTLYVQSDLEGAFVVDVTSPAAPTFVREILSPLDLQQIELRGNRLYGTIKDSFIDGIHIYDVADPAKPMLIGAHRARSTFAVSSADDTTVFLERANDGITKLDVSNPEKPVEVRTSGTDCIEGTLEAIDIDHVVCDDFFNMVSVDFTAMPPQYSAIGGDLSGAKGVRKIGNYVAVANDANQPKVTAIDPFDSMVLRSWARKLPDRPTSLAMSDSSSFVGISQKGVFAADYRPNVEPDPIFETELDIYPIMDVAPENGRLYVLQWDHLKVFDSTALPLTLLGEATFDSTSFKFRVSNGWAYIPEKNTVIIINANDPSAMAPISFDAGTNITDLAISGDRMYLVQAGVISQFDISNPGTPLLLGSHTLSGGAGVGPQAIGDIVYVQAFNATEVVDFTDPKAPVAKTIPARAVAVEDGLLVGLNGLNLEVYDLQNPASPMLIGTRPLDPNASLASRVEMDGPTAVVMSTPDIPETALNIIDLAAPKSPVNMGHLGFLNQQMRTVRLEGDRVWLGYSRVPGGANVLAAYPAMRNSVSLMRAGQGPVKANDNVTFTVNWLEHDKEGEDRVACSASAGTCNVDSVDKAQRTAQVTWQMPAAVGAHELAVAVGHQHLTSVGRTRVTVE